MHKQHLQCSTYQDMRHRHYAGGALLEGSISGRRQSWCHRRGVVHQLRAIVRRQPRRLLRPRARAVRGRGAGGAGGAGGWPQAEALEGCGHLVRHAAPRLRGRLRRRRHLHQARVIVCQQKQSQACRWSRCHQCGVLCSCNAIDLNASSPFRSPSPCSTRS